MTTRIITRILMVTILVATLMAACNSTVVELEDRPCRELEEIDSLMWKQPDSAFARLREFAASSKADSLDVFNGHYCQLLISELLYKNDYGQSNREELLKAVCYFDSLVMADGHGESEQDRNTFLDARAHYINGVGFYELGDLVSSCAEYLKALEVMEGTFEDEELTGKKAAFMTYTYNRLTELFSGQFMMDPAIACGERALMFCRIKPTSSGAVSNNLYYLGRQYDKINDLDSAKWYYGQALEEMTNTDNLVYRNIISGKALCDYQLGNGVGPSLDALKQVLACASDEGERLTRFLTIGVIFTEEKLYDSALFYLETVFYNNGDVASQIQAAECLRIIYDYLGDGEKLNECVRFLADHKKSEGENKALTSKLDDLFKTYMDQKQKKAADEVREKSIKKTIEIIIPVAILMIVVVVAYAKMRSKKLLKQQQTETARVLDEAEQRLKEVERKHQQWMAEAKERNAEELMAQRDRSEKEIAQTKERHAKELEEERKVYQKEREALRQILQSKEEQVRDLEMTLSQQQEEIVRRREAFLKEPVCKRINDLLHGRHITTRDTSYQHDDITLKEKDFKQLKEAVERHFEGFDVAMLGRCPSLKHNDLTLCHLYLMGLSEGEIAALRSRTYSGIKKQNESLQEKLGLDEGVAGYVLRVAEELCGTPTRSISQNSTLKGTWSDTLKGTQKKIVEIIINNPNVTIPQVAEQLDLNPRGIAKHFKALQEKGVIRRVGPDKGGHWEVIG